MEVIEIKSKHKANLHREMMGAFFDFYQSRKGHKYRKVARDERHLKNIRMAIQAQCPNITDEVLLATFRSFLIHINNRWLMDNLSLKNIDSQFNHIWAQVIKSKRYEISQKTEDERVSAYGPPVDYSLTKKEPQPRQRPIDKLKQIKP